MWGTGSVEIRETALDTLEQSPSNTPFGLSLGTTAATLSVPSWDKTVPRENGCYPFGRLDVNKPSWH